MNISLNFLFNISMNSHLKSIVLNALFIASEPLKSVITLLIRAMLIIYVRNVFKNYHNSVFCLN